MILDINCYRAVESTSDKTSQNNSSGLSDVLTVKLTILLIFMGKILYNHVKKKNKKALKNLDF
ncbi:hypothetical protein CBF29_08480 [Vagococcus elongatus]|uniref:Uncharacterized protein n=1 Tax=Vagococcus elongatus TaxID=180344 RepID=A0A430ASF0_9ENTE|nr:hypothetical protein CBF29_08480 [Vagococcus elongatus]